MEVTEFAQLISEWFSLIAVICFIGLVILMLLEL